MKRIPFFVLLFLVIGVSFVPAPEPAPGPVCLDIWKGKDTRQGGMSFWENPTDLKVKFLDGSEELHERVIVQAKKWTEHANIGFDFRGPDNADIRISFRGRGNWSYVGTSAREIENEKEPTMNLELRLNTPDEQFQRTVLHEFGHALGLVHEHQIDNDSPIRWNETAVIQAYAGMWTADLVREQILARYKAGTLTNSSAFDKHSIMLYPVPKGHTLDGFTVEWNNELSEGDKAFLAGVYGKPKG